MWWNAPFCLEMKKMASDRDLCLCILCAQQGSAPPSGNKTRLTEREVIVPPAGPAASPSPCSADPPHRERSTGGSADPPHREHSTGQHGSTAPRAQCQGQCRSTILRAQHWGQRGPTTPRAQGGAVRIHRTESTGGAAQMHRTKSAARGEQRRGKTLRRSPG